MYAERCTAVRYNAPLKTGYEHLLAAGKRKRMAQGKALAQQRLAKTSCVHPFEAFMRHEQQRKMNRSLLFIYY